MNEIKEVKEKADKGELIQYIVIKIDDEQYGINIKFIDNIVRMQQITRVPKVDAFLKGVINIRGEIVPVMSVRMKMGLSEDVIACFSLQICTIVLEVRRAIILMMVMVTLGCSRARRVSSCSATSGAR